MAFWHPFADMGAVSRDEFIIDRGEGPWVFDEAGDALPRRHRLALVRQPRPRPHGDRRRGRGADEASIEAYHTFADVANRPANAICEALAARAPMPNAKVFLTSGGGDSIEVAAKLARRHFINPGQPERVHLISRTQGYHGTHGFGTSLGGIEANVTNWGPLVPQTSVGPVRLAARAGGGDPPRRARQGRGVLLRAGDRRRRRPRRRPTATSRASPTSAPSTASCS